MLNAAVVGLGWWGGVLVEAVADSRLIRFTAATTRSRSEKDQAFAASHGLTLTSFDALIADPAIDAIVLATQPSGHHDHIVAAARAGKHVFCEKPFTMTKAEAEDAVAAMRAAGKVLALGYNRRFHPSWIDLQRRISAGELGTILHMECTMTSPNALTMPPEAWRAQAEEAPCGGLFSMGVHAIDGFIALAGAVDRAFCQSLHRAAPIDNDDTTTGLLRMKAGMTASFTTMTATAPTLRFQVFGSKAMAQLANVTAIAGQPTPQRRNALFGQYLIQPIKGEAEPIETPDFDVNRAELEAFAIAIAGGAPYPISAEAMIQGVAATDAVIASARSGQVETVR